MDEEKYTYLTENGKKTLNHNQVMKWTEHSPHAQTLDDSMASTFLARNKVDVEFLENLFTNILAAGNEYGYINYDISRLMLGRISIDYDFYGRHEGLRFQIMSL